MSKYITDEIKQRAFADMFSEKDTADKAAGGMLVTNMGSEALSGIARTKVEFRKDTIDAVKSIGEITDVDQQDLYALQTDTLQDMQDLQQEFTEMAKLVRKFVEKAL